MYMVQKQKVLLLVLILVLGAGGLALAAFNGDPTPEEILTQMVDRLDAAETGHAILTIEVDTDEKSGRASVEVWGQKPADTTPAAHPKFRAEVLETSEPKAEGAVAVSDGETVWFYAPAKETVWTGSLETLHEHDASGDRPDFESPQEAVDWLLEASEVTLLGTEQVADRDAYTLEFVPIAEKLPEAAAAGAVGTLWVDSSRWVPLQATFDAGSMGQGRVTAELVELDVDVSAELFTFQVPEDAEVVRLEDRMPQHLTLDEAEAAVEYDLLVPTAGPEAATLIDVVKIGDTIVLRYESADGPFAVSQGLDDKEMEPPSTTGESVAVRETTGTLYRNDAGTKVFLTWTEAGRTFTVSGAISAETALQIAESLQ